MINEAVVDVSRLQFAATAMYHFIFVPLTLGLSFLLAIIESTYVLTGRPIYREMAKFWGKLFGINFAMGVATGLPMEFQFGTNWAYYAHYVGDIFGAPLAIEGLMAFFLESTLVGVMLLGWNKLSRVQHLAVTWLVALGSNLSALWILVANGWMQYPTGAEFNLETMRMELHSFSELLFNPVAQVKFVHTVSAGYVTGAIFMLSIASFYLLRKRHIAFAQRSFAIAAGFGLAAGLSVIVLGDESGYTIGEIQKMKLALIEAEWETQKPPASFTLVGWPDQERMETRYAIKIPWALGLIATRSLDEPIKGIKDHLKENEERVRLGMVALQRLKQIRAGQRSAEIMAEFERYKEYLGYGRLLERYVADPAQATEADIHQAALATVPQVAPLFWTFRIMVGAGFFMLFVFMAAFFGCARRKWHWNWLFWLAFLSLPLPWLSSFCGWFVSEYGRQPWSIAGILPTYSSASNLSVSHAMASLVGFVLFYSVLLVVELYLMRRYVRLGPAH